MSGEPDPMSVAIAYGDAVGRSDVEAAVALFAADGSIVPGNVPGLPFGGIATGTAAVRRFLAGQAEHMEIVSNVVHAVTTGPRDLIAAATITGRFRATGRTFTRDAALHFAIDDDGRIVRYQVHEDTHAVLAALDSSPSTDELDAWTDDLHQRLREGDLEGLAARWADDITYQGPGVRLVGLEARIAAERPVLDAFSDRDVVVRARWHDGDAVIEHCVLRGRHAGPLDTEVGRIEATGRSIELEYVQILRWAHGKVVDQVISYDRADLIVQLTAPGSG